MKTLKYLLLAVSIALVLGACFSPYTGPSAETGTLSVYLGGGGEARTLVDIAREPDILRYDILLAGPGGQTREESFSGQTSAGFRLVPGEWRVTIKAYGYRDGAQDKSPDKNALRAMGSETAKIEAGKTSSVTVSMITATEVSTWAELASAAGGAYTAGQEGREEIIYIRSDLSAGTDPVTVKRNITLIAEADAAITRASGYKNALFMVNTGGILKLGHGGMGGTLTISGGYNSGGPPMDPADFSLISVSGGKLEMFDGVTLKDNDISTGSNHIGGAVHIGVSGEFAMSGGTISGNVAYNGGAVYVFTGGSFAMSGGEISGNKSGQRGGGVLVENGSSFTMSGGEISANDSAEGGGGICIWNGSSFTMSGGTVSGNTIQGLTTGYSSGIFHGGDSFTLSGGVRIENNNINLAGGATITVGGELTNSEAIKITLDSYTLGTPILTSGFPAGSESKFAIVIPVYCINASGFLNLVESAAVIDLAVNPSPSGVGWTYNSSDPSYTIQPGANVLITDSSQSGPSNRQVKIADGAAEGTRVTLYNAIINPTSPNPALELATGANLILTLIGNHALKGGLGNAGLQLPPLAALEIAEESTGELEVEGGDGATGIGGRANDDGGTITINGGTIIAKGGDGTSSGGTGIGGGINGNGGIITINGGKVFATGGNGASSGGTGIGGGTNGSGGTITINGGIITATGGDASNGGTGIGRGVSSSDGGEVTITGGLVKATGGSGNGNGIWLGNAPSGLISLNGNGVVFALADGSGRDFYAIGTSAYPKGILFEGTTGTGTLHGTTVTLQNDFEIPPGYTLTIGSGKTLDLNGHTITTYANDTITKYANGTIIKNGGKIVVGVPPS